ncbi:acid-sensing ion channel 2 [Drosophila ananassae]|uniref:acid-sensing ion channel 2 n=1 Tax=Drosophila ananassae TaxID=7217 RepID=UPI000177EFAE|nr:acid-sensing ion channel 2 [Drosophila ananassae]
MAQHLDAAGDNQKKQRRYGRLFWKFVTYLKDYCANCTLAGFAYIANHRLHPTERIFWLLCVMVSSFGCYWLIREYQDSYPTRAVSIVYESMPPFSKWKFPTVSVCEVVYKYQLASQVEDYVQSLGGDADGEYSFELETHVSYIIFPHQYHEGNIRGHCTTIPNCPQCGQCPKENNRQILTWYGSNCTDMFAECRLSDKVFDCCRYFLPLITPYGRCFMLNSLQNNRHGLKSWLPTVLDPATQLAKMQLITKLPVQVSLMNEEDIPHTALSPIGVTVTDPGQNKLLQFHRETMENDPDVIEIPPKIRNCLFPEENLPSSVYRAYSFSTCISDCTRNFQMEKCNCTHFIMNPMADPRYPDCNLEGLYCLEINNVVKPDGKLLLNNNKGYKESCGCLPSCNDGDIQAVYEAISEFDKSTTTRNITLSMPALPTDQFRRQALRSRLDVVVSMGGMLGLFLGASILSGIECIYYFTVRAFNNAWREHETHA